MVVEGPATLAKLDAFLGDRAGETRRPRPTGAFQCRGIVRGYFFFGPRTEQR
jgi:hypothetical protein